MAHQRDIGKVQRFSFFGMRRGGQDYSSETTHQYNSKPKDIDSNEAARRYGGAAYTTYSTKKKATCQHSNDTNNPIRRNDYYYGQNLENNQFNYNYYYKFASTTATKQDKRQRMFE